MSQSLGDHGQKEQTTRAFGDDGDVVARDLGLHELLCPLHPILLRTLRLEHDHDHVYVSHERGEVTDCDDHADSAQVHRPHPHYGGGVC